MSLLLLFGFPIPLTGGAAVGQNAPQVGTAAGTFVAATEVIVLVVPIQTTIALTLPIAQPPPVMVPA